jgi:hypothetical protein
MNSLTWLGSTSRETQATDTRETSVGSCPGQVVDLGLASQTTKARALTGIELDGVFIDGRPLFRFE